MTIQFSLAGIFSEQLGVPFNFCHGSQNTANLQFLKLTCGDNECC